MDYFIETSAKNGYNAKNVFIEAAKMLYKDYILYKDRSSRQSSIDTTTCHQFNKHIKLPDQPSAIELSSPEKSKDKKKCC